MSISNYDDVIDSRDIIERIEELEAEQAELVQKLSDGEISESDMKAWDDEEGQELDTLRALAEECEQYSSDWEYGVTLIRYSYIEEYCQDLLEDCGDIPKDLPWYIAIDWEQTAQNILQDYSEVDFNGVSYYIQAS